MRSRSFCTLILPHGRLNPRRAHSLAAKKPEQFKVVFALDKPPKNWSGPTGYVSDKVITEALKDFGTTPDKGDKVKIFVCASGVAGLRRMF